jgi:hypothetical protein
VNYIDILYVLIVCLAIRNNEARFQVSVGVTKINELYVSVAVINHMLSGSCQHGMVCPQVGE